MKRFKTPLRKGPLKDLTNTEMNSLPAVTIPVNTSTPIRKRMVPRQCKIKDMVRTLFTRESKVKGMSQVVTVRMEDLQMVDSDSEEEVRNQNKDMSEVMDISLGSVIEKLDKDQNDDEDEVAATLLEDCQSDHLTAEIVENNFSRDEERARLSHPPPKYMAGFSTAAGRNIEMSEKALNRNESAEAQFQTGLGVDSDVVASCAENRERDLIKIKTADKFQKSSIEERMNKSDDQFQAGLGDDNDDLAGSAETTEREFNEDEERKTINEKGKASVEDRVEGDSGCYDEVLASSAGTKERDFMRMDEEVGASAAEKSMVTSIEERMASAVREIAADILKTLGVAKKVRKTKDTDKEMKKTLKKLSYHEKVQRDIRLVKEHLVEQLNGISSIVYSCRTCGESFPPTVNKVLATRHAISHSVPKKRQRGQNRTYECAFCGLTVKTKKEHVKHYQEHHCVETQTLKCTKCSKTFTELSSLSDHLRRVHLDDVSGGKEGEVQVCPECGRKLETKKLLSRHMKTVHRKVKSLNCEMCGKLFRDNFGLKRHLREGHKLGFGDDSLSNKSDDQEQDIGSGVNGTRCPICDKLVRKLNWHLRQTHGLDKNLNPTFSKFKHHCERCEKPFRDKCNLERHIPSCHKSLDDDRKCNICNKSFHSKRNKEIHIKEIHMTAKICEKCGFNFTDKKAFYQHLPCQYSCKCGKKFSNQYKFNRHKEKCLSSNPEVTNMKLKSSYHNVISYQCIICQESDLRTGEVRNHVTKTHGNLSVNEAVSCESCGCLVNDVAEHIFERHSQVRRMKKTYVKFIEDPNRGSLSVKQPVAMKSNPVPEKSYPVAMKSNPIAVKSNLVGMNTNPVAPKSNPVALKSNSLALKSNPFAMKSNPVVMKSNPVAMKSNPVAVKSNPVAMKSIPNALDCKSVADPVSVQERLCGRTELIELSTMVSPLRFESGGKTLAPGTADSLPPPPFIDPPGDPPSLSETEIISLLTNISSILQEESSTPSLLVSGLLKLATVPVTVPALRATGVGKVVRRLKDREGKLGRLAGKLVSKWKRIALQYEPQPSTGDGQAVSEDVTEEPEAEESVFNTPTE